MEIVTLQTSAPISKVGRAKDKDALQRQKRTKGFERWKKTSTIYIGPLCPFLPSSITILVIPSVYAELWRWQKDALGGVPAAQRPETQRPQL